MERQALSFEEILEKEELILADASISTQDEKGFDWYFNEVYPADHFSEISEGVLRYVRDDLNFFVSFLENSHVYTSKGVALEVKNARKMVNEKIEYLEEKEPKDSFSMELSDHGSFRKRLRRKKNHNPNNGGNTQRELLREIRELFHESYCQSRRSILPVQRNLYHPLENLVLEVTKHTKAKRDFGYRYGKPGPKSDKEDFHTDEQLVSLAIYSSVQGEESCIVTRDSDLRRILFNTIRYLLDPNASDFQIDVLEDIGTNGIRIYNTLFSGLEFDTSRPESMTRLPSEEVSKINQALAS